MAAAEWSIAIGIFTYMIAIIFAVIYYLRYRKIYLVIFVAAVATYIFSVFYIWDVFDPQRNVILLLLLFSTGIMIFIGKYLSKIELKPAKMHTSLKEKTKNEK